MFWTVLGVEPLCCACLATLWLALVPCCGSVLWGWPGEFFAVFEVIFRCILGRGCGELMAAWGRCDSGSKSEW